MNSPRDLEAEVATENDAAPTPWTITGSSIVDAEGRLVCVLAGRLLGEPRWARLLADAPELYDLLCEFFLYLETAEVRPDREFLDRMDAVFDKFDFPK
jgi:hypothetical protein